jgi:hypothetical protein
LTVSGIQVSKAPRKSLEVTSLGSSEKIFGTSNLYRLCIQLAKRAVKGMQAYSGEYSFTLGLTVDSSFTARLPTQIHFSPRLSLSLSIYLSIYLSLSPDGARIALHSPPPHRRRRTPSPPVTVLLVRHACEAGHPSSSVGRSCRGRRRNRSWELT